MHRNIKLALSRKGCKRRITQRVDAPGALPTYEEASERRVRSTAAAACWAHVHGQRVLAILLCLGNLEAYPFLDFLFRSESPDPKLCSNLVFRPSPLQCGRRL